MHVTKFYFIQLVRTIKYVEFEDNPIFLQNKKYVLWNAGICPIALKVGHVILATPLLGSFIVPYVVLAMAYPTKKQRV